MVAKAPGAGKGAPETGAPERGRRKGGAGNGGAGNGGAGNGGAGNGGRRNRGRGANRVPFHYAASASAPLIVRPFLSAEI
jgi:hypothetical protein